MRPQRLWWSSAARPRCAAKVRDAVVAIGGNVNIEGAEVGDAVVAVMGGWKVARGSIVHGDVVAVGGGTDVAEARPLSGQIQPVEIPGVNVPRLALAEELAETLCVRGCVRWRRKSDGFGR